MTHDFDTDRVPHVPLQRTVPFIVPSYIPVPIPRWFPLCNCYVCFFPFAPKKYTRRSSLFFLSLSFSSFRLRTRNRVRFLPPLSPKSLLPVLNPFSLVTRGVAHPTVTGFLYLRSAAVFDVQSRPLLGPDLSRQCSLNYRPLTISHTFPFNLNHLLHSSSSMYDTSPSSDFLGLPSCTPNTPPYPPLTPLPLKISQTTTVISTVPQRLTHYGELVAGPFFFCCPLCVRASPAVFLVSFRFPPTFCFISRHLPSPRPLQTLAFSTLVILSYTFVAFLL